MMRLIPRAILIAVTTPADCDSVVGDLDEEFARRSVRVSRAEAERWYWAQALRSVPSLLSYGRSRRSFFASARTVAAVIIALCAMMLCFDRVSEAISKIHSCAKNANDLCLWPYFLYGWTLTAAFGAMLTAVVRSSIRLTLYASIGLVASIAVPTMLGYSSPLAPPVWALLLSVIPAMSCGGAVYRIMRAR